MPAPEPLPPPSFAVTKILPPAVRRGAVPRPRLDDAVAAALANTAVVAFVAPAGFGKTVALAFQLEPLRAAGHGVAWIGADADDDLPRLLRCLVAALEPLDVPWRRSPDAIAAGFDGADLARRKALTDEVVNALASTDVARAFIVIDDVHRIVDPAVLEFLERLGEHLPPAWCLVLATRAPLPLPAARWRAAGRLADFGADELRFDREEAARLVAPVAASPQGAELDALVDRTHGWAAGLCLALQAGRRGAALADRHVFDYLASEVLAQMPAAKRLFLVRCSVLPALSPVACEAVSLDPLTRRWLGEIEREDCFGSVRGSGAGAALVLHDLFRDCLEELLVRERPDELPALLRRAAAVEPDVVRRVALLTRAGAGAEALAALAEVAPALLTSGESGAVLRMIDHLPAAVRGAPEVDFVRGLAGWAHWDFDAMRHAMHRAAAGFARAGDGSGRDHAEAHEAIALASLSDVRAATRLIDGLLARPLDEDARLATLHARALVAVDIGPLDDACGLLEVEFDSIERRPSAVRWYKAIPLSRHVGLPGFRPLLERFIAHAPASAPDGPSALSALTTLMRGWLDVWAGRAERAAPLIARTLDDARWLAQGSVVTLQAGLATAFVEALRGDADAALAALRGPQRNADALPPGPRRQLLTATFGAIELRIASFAGRPDAVLAAADRLDRSGLPANGPPWRPRDAGPSPDDDALGPALCVAIAALQGHVALARGDLDAAHRLWHDSLAAGERRLRLHGLDLELRVRLAAGAAQRKAPAEAANLLRPVFARAASAEEHLPAVFAGSEALERLAAADWGDTLALPERHLLDHWRRLADAAARRPAPAASTPAPTPPGGRAPAGDLTSREGEVLARLAAGESNKVIARALDLSPFTVKRHVANILDKLGCSSRGQAAAWFHAAG